jgi:hypothetical protein
MTSRMLIAMSFTAGLAVCGAFTIVLDQPSQELAGPAPADPGQPLGAMPRSREHAAVLSWVFEHRPDAMNLEYLLWSPPRPVAEDPFTHGPATLVELVVKNKSTAGERLEYLSFYLRGFDVLGSFSQPQGRVKLAVCL